MSWKRIVVLLVLADFSALTAYAVYQVGYVGFFEALLGNIVGVVVLCDLVIALGMVSLWMISDARERGAAVVPYLVLTLLLGSVGPLLYLLRRPEAQSGGSLGLAAPAR